MLELYDKHADKKHMFEFLAIHDATVQNFEELDAKLVERDIPNKYWEGKELPFPVLLDPNRDTVNKYHISAFPTMLLISPSGRLIHHGHGEVVSLMDEILSVPSYKLRGAKTNYDILEAAIANVKSRVDGLENALKGMEGDESARNDIKPKPRPKGKDEAKGKDEKQQQKKAAKVIPAS